MQTLVRAMQGRGGEGRALPGAFSMLDEIGAKLRYGQTSVIVGAPGSGKSALALTWAMRTNVPTLYFSADSDRMTIGTRIGASVTRHTVDEVEAGLIGADGPKWHRLIDQNTRHMWFSWDASLGIDDIESELLAYATVTGRWPGLVVVDNLKNVWTDGGDDADHIRFDRAIGQLNEFAREYGPAVLFLHHATGQYEDGYTPIPLAGLLGKCGKDVTLALTLHRGPVGSNEMRVCVVKNRVGKADPGGNLSVGLPFVPERMWFGGGE
jgi:replicative DNA helicase